MMFKGYKVLDEELFSVDYSYGQLFTLSQLASTPALLPVKITNFTECKIWDGN